jgi:regulator of protease activity HflC (stomatin/prohibitin superfamily)
MNKPVLKWLQPIRPPADDEAVAEPPAGLPKYFGMSKRRFRRRVAGLLLLLLLLLLWRYIFIPIASGQAGVLWSRLGGGTVMDRRYGEGYHVIWPWDHMAIYDMRLQEMHDTVQVLTVDGLQVSMQVTVRFAPRADELTVLHRSVGPRYRETVIWPDVVAAVRHVVRRFKPEDLTVLGEEELGAKVDAAARRSVQGHWVDLDRVLITRITLPRRVQAQIQEKLADEQKALAAPFILRQAELKRQSWRIEADGAREFQSRSGISLLKWRNLDALERLASSANSKIVVLGGEESSMPLVLDAGRDAPPAPSAPVGKAKGVKE